ncbi:DUF305 domain-containing protein [Cyanobium sp. NIES-981]|uniref:DUF305 domain-containing protein n=1 Tax=Cyanobium sp. NIES-981 TaxID=1851505 RepID=UPI000B3578DA|nr:DUF305 domain-containing protein [Cyanobium sp. NIES-981]
MALGAPGLARAQPSPSMPGMDHRHHATAAPAAGEEAGHGSHAHDVGPAGETYDLRFLDAMVQHHTGALRMSEFVFGIGEPGVGALATTIWREQAREIRAMGLWRKAWYPEAPIYPVALRPGGNPDAMADLERMGSAQIEAMQMVTTKPTRANRVVWFLESMIEHHGGALQMAHDALEKSSTPTIRRLAREIIVTQRLEIIQLRRMLQHDGLNKPAYYRFDPLFSL